MGKRSDRRRRRKERRNSNGRARVWKTAKLVFQSGDSGDDLRDKVAKELVGGGDFTFLMAIFELLLPFLLRWLERSVGD